MNPSSGPFAQHQALVRLIHAVQQTGYQFVTPTPATHQRVNARSENEWATDLRGALGWSRPFLSDVVPGTVFELLQEARVLERFEQGWRSRIRLSSAGGALYLHSAYPTDSPDSVFFGPDSYRFIRGVNVHLHTRKLPVERAFDLGCGAGPGALTVALAQPTAKVWAGDINTAALQLAGANAAAAGAHNVVCCTSDLFSAVQGQFDLITANPPYLNDGEKRRYRHGGGRYGEQLALTMLEQGISRLALGGTLLLYTGSAIVDGQDLFWEDAQDILRPHAGKLVWSLEEMDVDVFGEELDMPAYADAERIAVVLLEVTRTH